jgi:putative ABC transport system permease protein
MSQPAIDRPVLARLIARILEDLMRDVRHTARGLGRSPGFAIAVVLTLALGIGGNTAIFSVVDQLLLRPLPYPNGEQLLTINEVGFGKMSVSPANWLDWQRENRTLQHLAAWNTQTLTLTGVGEPTRLNAQVVSAEFFPLLGVQPLLGRAVSAEDDRPTAARVAVLSYRLWKQRFGGDPGVVGRVIQLNDRPVQVIGVMPAGFQFLYPDNDMWAAYRLDRNLPWRETAGRFIKIVARLKPNTTMAAARSDMEALAQRLAAKYAFNKNTTVAIVPLREELTGQVHASLLVLYSAVGVLLSIACFNVANLLLARAASRRRELATRTSLGAGRVAIARQLVVESLMLAGAGGALGIAFAHWSLQALMAFAPADLLRVPALSVDRRVLWYALGLSVLTGLIVGLAPAVLVARRSMSASIQASGSRVTQSPRIRQALVVCQVAMTVVLLCGAGLLVRTLVALNGAANGFDKRDVLTMEVALPGTRYTPERTTAFYRQAIARLRALPGVESAAGANSPPVLGSPRGGSSFRRFSPSARPMDQQSMMSGDGLTLIRVVTPGYFHVLRIPVLRGREFTDADEANPTPGFVVNEAFAKAFLADVDPVTTAISVFMQQENPFGRIIGIVGDVSEGSVRDRPQPTVFYSHRQMPETIMTLMVRTTHPEGLSHTSVTALHGIDPTLAVTKIQTLESIFADSLARERLSALVSGAFALSGLLLASLGLYALLSFLVGERTREIGIRIALGAQVGWLTRSVVGGGLRLVAVGATIGVAVSLLLLRLFGTLLFGVTPYDLPTYAAVLGLFSVVAATACYMPARGVARVDPIVALRQE